MSNNLYICIVLLIFLKLGTISGEQCEEKSFSAGYFYTDCDSGCCSPRTHSPCCPYESYNSYISYTSTLTEKKLTVGAIVGIVFAVLILIGITITVIVCCFCVARNGPASAGQVITSGQRQTPIVITSGQQQAPTPYGVALQSQSPNGYGYSNAGYAPGVGTPAQATPVKPPPY